MFGSPFDPGLHDRAEADFKAKLLEHPAAPEEFPTPRPRGFLWVLGNWALLLAAAALIAIVFEYMAVYIAIAIALGLIAAAQIALPIWRSRHTREGG